jgi:hypothetical protein
VDDPTEVDLAIEVFGDYEFWINLRSTWVLKDLIPQWEEEANQKRIAKQLKNILLSTEDEKSRMQASKYLLENAYRFTPSKEDGRKARAKNKEKITETLNNEAFHEDINRLSTMFN